jgi:hypothetical protein
VSSGRLIFVRQGALFAQGFDATRRELVGEPARVVEQITNMPVGGARLVALSVSPAGRIVYRTGSPVPTRFQLAWFDRSGKQIETLTDQLPVVLNAALSPDDQRVAMFTGNDIWFLELRSRNLRRFTLHPAIDFAGIFSPAGDHVTFSLESQRRLRFVSKAGHRGR